MTHSFEEDAASTREASSREEELAVENIMKQLVELVLAAEGRGVNFADSFKHFDKNGDGEISQEEFSRGLSQLGFPVLRKQVDALFHAFDIKLIGDHDTVKYEDFIDAVKYYGSSPDATVGGGDDRSAFVDFDTTWKKIEVCIREAQDNNFDVWYHFEMRENSSNLVGTLSTAAFRAAILGIPGLENMSLPEMTELSVRFGTRGEESKAASRVRYRDFLAAALGHKEYDSDEGETKSQEDDLPLTREEAIERVRDLMRVADTLGVSFQSAFEHFDTDLSGFIDLNEFYQGFAYLNIDISIGDVARLANALLKKLSWQENRLS